MTFPLRGLLLILPLLVVAAFSSTPAAT